MFKFKKFLFGLLRVDFWYQQYTYDKGYDEVIDKIIENELVPSFGYMTAKIGDLEIWTENYPYAYGRQYKGTRYSPSRYNIYRLHRHLENVKKNNVMEDKDRNKQFLFEQTIADIIGIDCTIQEVKLAMKQVYPEKFI